MQNQDSLLSSPKVDRKSTSIKHKLGENDQQKMMHMDRIVGTLFLMTNKTKHNGHWNSLKMKGKKRPLAVSKAPKTYSQNSQ